MDPSEQEPRTLFEQLRRRGVLQALGVYLVASWAAIEVASTILPYLGFPDAAVTGIIVILGLGAPVVCVVAWAFDFTSDGVRRAGSGAAGLAPVARVASGRLPVAAAALVVGMSAVALVWSRRFAPPPVDNGAVAVFPFAVQGDSASMGHLGEGMVTLLSRQLDGVAGLRSTDPNTILSLTDNRPGSLRDPRFARAVANQVGAARFVLGTVTELAGRVSLSASLYSADESGAPVTAGVEGTLGTAFALAEDLLAQLLAQQVGPVSRDLSRGAARDTESLTAFKAFVDAERDLRANRIDSAITGFQAAVAEDDGFALAYYRLAVAGGLRRNYRLVQASLAQARAHIDRLGARDRRMLEAFETLRDGRIDDAEELYGAVIQDYPDAWEARFHLGEMLSEHNPARGRPAAEGRPLLEAVMEVDPEFVCPSCTLANHALSERDIDRSDSIQYARVPKERLVAYAAVSAAARQDSADFARFYRRGMELHWQSSWLAAWFEDYDWSERLLLAMADPEEPEAKRLRALFQLSDLHVARGRWADASRTLARAEVTAPGRTLLRRALHLTHPMGTASEAEIGMVFDRLASWSGTAAGLSDLDGPLASLLPTGRLYLLGLLEARRGQTGAASAWADSLDASPPQVSMLALDLARTIRADLSLRSGRPTEALGHLEAIRGQVPVHVMDLTSAGPARLEFSDLFTEEHARLLRVRALLEAGRPAEALRWVENGFFRLGGNPLVTPEVLRLGAQALAATGDTTAAVDRYERFLRLVSGADADHRATVDDVRARVSELTRSP